MKNLTECLTFNELFLMFIEQEDKEKREELKNYAKEFFSHEEYLIFLNKCITWHMHKFYVNKIETIFMLKKYYSDQIKRLGQEMKEESPEDNVVKRMLIEQNNYRKFVKELNSI